MNWGRIRIEKFKHMLFLYLEDRLILLGITFSFPQKKNLWEGIKYTYIIHVHMDFLPNSYYNILTLVFICGMRICVELIKYSREAKYYGSRAEKNLT